MDVANGTKDSPHGPAEVASESADQAVHSAAARPGTAEPQDGRPDEIETSEVSRFTLEIDFDHQPHSAGADRAFVGRALDAARREIMSSAKTEGVLRVPKVGVPDPVVIGNWKIDL